MASSSSQKNARCEYCAETIALAAKICRHCQRAQVFDIYFDSTDLDNRAVYHLGREMVAAVPQLAFEAIKQALRSPQSPLLRRAPRQTLSTVRDVCEKYSVSVRVQSPEVDASLVAIWPMSGGRVIAGALAAVLVSGAALFVFVGGSDKTDRPESIGNTAKTPGSEGSSSSAVDDVLAEVPAEARRPLDATDLAEKLLSGVVVIHCDTTTGTGFFVTQDLVVTNHHVVCDGGNLQIKTNDGTEFGGQLYLADEVKDLAIISVSGANGRPLVLGDAAQLKTGQTVYAAGTPHGLEFTLSRGIISHPSRFIEGLSFIQTDASLNPGNSGGPLVNEAGEVVGVVSLKGRGEGLGYALPINYLLHSIGDGLVPPGPDYDASQWQRTLDKTREKTHERLEEYRAIEGRPFPVRASVDGRGYLHIVSVSLGKAPEEELLEFRASSADGESCPLPARPRSWKHYDLSRLNQGSKRTRQWREKTGRTVAFSSIVSIKLMRYCPAGLRRKLQWLTLPQAPAEMRKVPISSHRR